MKKNALLSKILSPAIAAAIASVLTLALPATAAPNTWKDPAGGNWSVGTNWTSLAVPVTTDDVIFGDVGAGTTNDDDITGETINSLSYNQDDGLLQTTVINPGQTLTITGTGAAGTPLLYVGSVSASTTSSTLVDAAIQGAASTLQLNGAGDIWVSQGNATAGGHNAKLDLSGLGTFSASVGRLLVGTPVNGINRVSGSILLAQTNTLTFTGASPQVEVGEAVANGNSGQASMVFSFGQNTQLFADTMRLGGDKCAVTMNFAAALNPGPSLKMRNSDGVSPCTVIDFGYANGDGGTGTTETMAADFSAGSVDILANLIHISQGQPGSGTGGATGTVTLGAGTVTVPDLEIGYGNATLANSGGCTGTLNVNNNGLFTNGATVVCSTVLNLAHTNGASLSIAPVTATLTIGSDNSAGNVIANTITSGGGVSTINLNAGTLTVSNTIGSVALPIRFFSMGQSGGATLNIPLSNAGSAIVVSNLVAGGANLVNITAVPGIAVYPATFTLIQYQGAEGGTGPGSFMIHSLPAASPPYAASIVDSGNGLVQVTFSSGPIAVLATTWTGAVDNNWDLSTQNWLYQGVAADFVDGRSTLFNDSTTQTNLLLDAVLTPSSVSVNNSVKQYTFGGTGSLATSLLTKSGSSSLTLDNSGGNNNISTVVINSGTLQLGVGDANGGIASVNITNNGALVVDRTDSLTLSAAISGSGTLTQGGSGTLILSGANSYNGATSVTNGTLEIDQTTSGTGPVTTSAGTVLSGFGVVNGPVTVGGTLSPGSPTVPGNFQAGSGLTLATGSTLNFGLSASDTSTSDGANDSVIVTGNLTAHNNPINVAFAGAPQGGSTYTLFTYTGSLSGSFNPVVTGTHFAASVDTNATGVVNLDITGSSGFNLKWNSTSDGTWDLGTANWLNLANSTASTFAAGDNVLLDDTSGVQNALTIGAGVTVYPAAIVDATTNNNFTISGAGSIGGTTGITKAGPSFLLLGTVNTFTGPVDIQGGTLVTQNGAALGNASSVTVEPGATLDVDGQGLGSLTITAGGAGVGGQGAIVNSGGAQAQVFRTLNLTGDTTLGGPGNLEMNNSGGGATVSTGGNPYKLTKVSPSVFNFQNVAAFDAALGDIDIQAGTLLFNGLTPNMGDPAHTLTVETGATLAFGGDQITWSKQFVFNGDGSTINLNNEGGANCVIAGPIQLNGDCVFSIGGTQLGISGGISGSGGLIKSGASLLILSGTNTYTGDTVVNTGTLQLTNGANLTTSSNITIAAGASVDTQGAGFTLVNGQTLNGNGTLLNSSLTAGVGSTVSPGVGGTGKLTVNGAVTLAGTTAIELDPANTTNDVLNSTSTIAYGGTLSLTALSPLSGNSSFKIFNATSYSGTFANISPATPGPGQTWDTSALRTTGTIKVGSTAAPRLTSISVSGTTLHINATNGTASGPVVLLGTTNINLPLSQWTHLLTNSFNSGGGLNLSTNIINTNVHQEFYILSQ